MMPWMPFENTTPGDEFTVFDLPGIGRVGLLICFDAWVPGDHPDLGLDGC